MVRKRLFLTLLILFVLMSAIGCGKTNGGGGTPEYSLSIAVNPEGSGQVITEPSGPRYKKGTTVSLTAAPNTGWAFHQWTGGITGTKNPTTIVMNANKTVTANFVRMKHTLTVNTVGEGTVTQEIVAIEAAMSTEYDYGTKVKLTAQPSPGWLFSHWEGDLTGNTNPAVIELDSDKNVTAVFTDYVPVVEFPDPNLEAAIRDALDKPAGNIYVVDLLELVSLDASSYNIQNLSGLEYCVNLQELYLWDNQISDISALSGLTNLEYLYLGNNQISDISALAGLTNLYYLDLYENQIENISALANLINLQYLYLWNNQISDISALAGLTNLWGLSLWHNQISDISALSGLTNLRDLSLSYNQISDISALSGLTNLRVLSLLYNQISDISALSGLTNLRVLSLSYNQISDITALSGLTNLQYLYLGNNQISDITALAGLTNLQKLDLTNNPNLDTSPGSDNRIIIDDLIDKGCVVYFDEAGKANSLSIEQEKYKKDFMDERIKKNMSKKK
jgi:hypothetical protein